MEWLHNRFKSDELQIVLVALAVAIAGEFKITPFSGQMFRVGLGSSAFLLFILFMRRQLIMKMGIVVGVTVLLFRITGDMIAGSDPTFLESLRTHFSAMLYYIVFAIGMRLIQHRLDDMHPLIVGLCVTATDFASNATELLVRSMIFHWGSIPSDQWLLIAIVAVVRSFFTVGLYSSMMVRQMRILHAEQQKRMEQMLNVGSGLYGEVFYLRKSMNAIEQITASSYELYGRLQQAGDKQISRSMLEITQQIHEVKKDSQRILAGLLKLSNRETSPEMALGEIIDFVVKSNQEYAAMLNKNVGFTLEKAAGYSTTQSIPLLTVLNNLVSNAVEAVQSRGRITIRVWERQANTLFSVSDNGAGIQEQDRELVFKPGFTTKFNQDGIAATGIGLSHVSDIVQSFGGSICLDLEELATETTFVVTIPTAALKKGEMTCADLLYS
ncbi:sensor histidine kinase [Paenibacillus cremeus]|nr:sensor histidine kinase [Paenibacillus cremeus]